MSDTMELLEMLKHGTPKDRAQAIEILRERGQDDLVRKLEEEASGETSEATTSS